MMTFKTMRIFTRAIGVLILTLGLGACGSIIDTGQDMEADSIFDLEPLQGAGPGGDSFSVFMQPVTYPAYLGTFKIAVKPNSQEVQYLAGARWSDQAPALVSRFLQISMENQGEFLVIGSRQTAYPTDYRLAMDIREFSAMVEPGQNPVAVVEIRANLISGEDGNVIATKHFRAMIGAADNSRAAIAAAFQNAMEGVSRNITNWIKETR